MLVQTTPGFCLGPAGWNRPRKGCRPLVEHLACAGSASSLSTDRSSFDLSPRHRYRLTRIESLAQPSVLSLSYAPVLCAARSGQCRRSNRRAPRAHTVPEPIFSRTPPLCLADRRARPAKAAAPPLRAAATPPSSTNHLLPPPPSSVSRPGARCTRAPFLNRARTFPCSFPSPALSQNTQPSPP
jgi:hypothetical protein